MFRWLVVPSFTLLGLFLFGCSGHQTILPPIQIETAVGSETLPTLAPVTTSVMAVQTVPAVPTATVAVIPTATLVVPTQIQHVSVMADTNQQKSLCVGIFFDPTFGGKLDVSFVNQQVCVFNGKGSLEGQVLVFLINPPNGETDSWLKDVSFWLQGQGIVPCSQTVSYRANKVGESLDKMVLVDNPTCRPK